MQERFAQVALTAQDILEASKMPWVSKGGNGESEGEREKKYYHLLPLLGALLTTFGVYPLY